MKPIEGARFQVNRPLLPTSSRLPAPGFGEPWRPIISPRCWRACLGRIGHQ